MSKFTRGDAVFTPDGTLATFIKEVDDMTSAIAVGADSRLVATVTLKKRVAHV